MNMGRGVNTMRRMFRGMLWGGLIGAATTFIAVNSMQPNVGRHLMRRGRCLARQIRRRFADFEMN